MAAPIAIVGISVELPSGSYSTKNLDHPSFFQFLLDGGESYEHIPGQRFNVDAWRGDHPGQVKVDTGSFLKDIDLFDNVEFGISSRDARAMAPVTRRLIEHSFLALLDAGIDYRGKRVGCYMSGNGHDLMSVTDADEYEASGSFAGYPSMVANRISTHLDLRGPSIPVDTACSSTLTALHLAIQAIRNDECEAAVVGGCQLNHRFIDWVTYSQGSLLAKDGKCKPFDANADGFSRAEGCVVVVVKLLENALRDHDRVYATILASAINSSGGQAPPGAPVASAQHDSMLQAFKLANRLPQEVDYIELHATGTSKGDPTEANWIGAQFQRDEELMIGSVKGNTGHTEIVAFMASLSKVLSMFQHRVIPPNVNVRSLNPAIRWEQYKLHLPLRPTPLSCRSGRKPLIAMASSGIGGSNGHVVLEGPPTLQKSSFGAFNSEHVLALLMAGGLSPRSVTSISESVNQLAVKDPVDVCTLSTVLGRRSRQMTWGSYAIWDSKSSEPLRFSPPQHTFRVANPLVFVFSGQGPQHVHMGRELFKISSAFRDSILEMDVVFSRITNKSIIHDYGLFDGDSAAQSLDVWPISLILPAIAMVQIALFDLLVTLGITPDIIIGHSAGETAVLYASGAASKAMVVELAILRGMVFAPLESLGASMVALSCSPEEAETIMEEARLHYPDTVLELACYNSPNAIVMAGHNHGLDQVLVLAEARGIFARRIRTRVPIHSSLMENCKREYCCRLDELFSRYPGSHSPTISTYSTLTGDLADGSFNAEYFWKNTRGPVRFTEAIHAIARIHPSCTFVEIAPHPALSAYISSMVSDSSTVLTTLRRPKQGRALSEYRDLLEFIGKLIVTGHDCVDFTILNGRACHDYDLNVPAYPFVRKQYPLYADTPGYMKQMEPHRGSLNHPYLKVNKDTHPILGEHIIRGQPIMPAAGFIEMALEFGATSLMNVNMRSILSLSSERPTKLDVRLEGSYWSVRSFTSVPRARGEPISTERLHADGYLSYEKPKQANKLDISAIRKQCPSHVGSAFYDSLSYFSSYGPHFRRVTHVYYGFKQALASIRGMDGRLARDGKYIIHPAILDSCLHVAAYKSFHGDFNPNAYFLPASVETVIVHQPLKAHNASAHLYAHLELKKWMPGQ